MNYASKIKHRACQSKSGLFVKDIASCVLSCSLIHVCAQKLKLKEIFQCSFPQGRSIYRLLLQIFQSINGTRKAFLPLNGCLKISILNIFHLHNVHVNVGSNSCRTVSVRKQTVHFVCGFFQTPDIKSTKDEQFTVVLKTVCRYIVLCFWMMQLYINSIIIEV